VGEVPTYRGSKLVGIDERGNRCGEDHPRAKLSDAEVELIRELAEPSDGSTPMAKAEIARKFEVRRSTVSDIVHFRQRASYPVGWRRVMVTVRGHDIVTTAVGGVPGMYASQKRRHVRVDPPSNDCHG
jgi:hypothetical protein